MMGARTHTLSPLLLLSLLLCVGVGVYAAKPFVCTYTDSKGNFYDLSPLSSCNLNGYSVQTSSNVFYLNVCAQVARGNCDNSSAVCQTGGGTFSAGSTTKQTFSDAPSGSQGVTLTYSNGDTTSCPNNAARTTKITFTCDKSATTPVFEFANEQPTCTYNFNARSSAACPVSSGPQKQTCTIDVFLVPHTHDDVGWLQTIDGYYNSAVRSILNQATMALSANPARRFVYVEQAFFHKWWTDTTVSQDYRTNFTRAYNNGQVEFVIGGWTMHDDACSTYGADIDQFTVGHQFLYKTFGAKPTRGWQLDPFGSGAVTGYLEKLAGFKSHLIDRITQKPQMQATQTLQFMWQGVESQGEAGGIFTEVMDGNLNAYCDWMFAFDFESQTVTDANVEAYAQKFYRMAIERVPHFRTTNILAAWGCDFYFTSGVNAFNNMDKLLAYIQKDQTTNINVKYATVSDYFEAVEKSSQQNGITYPVNKGGDYFNYIDGGTWTGYFTSRTVLKGMIRTGEAVARVAEQVYALGRSKFSNNGVSYDSINNLRMANAEATHHDGVTGTSEPAVVTMYENDLTNGMQGANGAIQKLLGLYINSPAAPALDSNLNSLINIASGQVIPVVLYNSLSWSRTQVITLPSNYQNLVVYNNLNKLIPSQVNQNLLSNGAGKFNLFFEVALGPLQYTTVFVQASKSELKSNHAQNMIHVADDSERSPKVQATTASNNYYSISIDSPYGISQITNLASKVSANVNQQLYYYQSQPDGGVYVFNPQGPAKSLGVSKQVVFSGAVVTEILQTYTDYASVVVRLYNSSSVDGGAFVELATQIGVLPNTYEVISLFQTNLNNRGIFYTDDNGFEYVTRNSAATPVTIANQHYPSIYASYIQDNGTQSQFSIVSDRAHSIASINNGNLEVMLHRNPAGADHKGMDNSVDKDVAYPVIRVVLDKLDQSKLTVKKQSYFLNFPVKMFSSSSVAGPQDWSKFSSQVQLLLNNPLPDNVLLQSFNALDSTSGSIILRFTHVFASDEHPTLGQPVTLNLSNLFSQKVTFVSETTLTANSVLSSSVPAQITLTPKAIRTFLVTL